MRPEKTKSHRPSRYAQLSYPLCAQAEQASSVALTVTRLAARLATSTQVPFSSIKDPAERQVDARTAGPALLGDGVAPVALGVALHHQQAAGLQRDAHRLPLLVALGLEGKG